MLKRRDAVLDLLPSSASSSDKQKLRGSKFDNHLLFEQSDVDSINSTIESSIQREANVKLTSFVSGSSSSSSKPKDSKDSRRPAQSQRQSSRSDKSPKKSFSRTSSSKAPAG